jgi:hypothetical protein
VTASWGRAKPASPPGPPHDPEIRTEKKYDKESVGAGEKQRDRGAPWLGPVIRARCYGLGYRLLFSTQGNIEANVFVYP